MRCIDAGYDPCLILVAEALILQNENISRLQCFKKHVDVIAIMIKTGNIYEGRVKLSRGVPCKVSWIGWVGIGRICQIIEK